MTAYTPLSNFVLAAPRLKVQKKPVAVDKPPVVKKQLSEEELELKRENDRERKRKSRANGGVEKKEEEIKNGFASKTEENFNKVEKFLTDTEDIKIKSIKNIEAHQLKNYMESLIENQELEDTEVDV